MSSIRKVLQVSQLYILTSESLIKDLLKGATAIVLPGSSSASKSAIQHSARSAIDHEVYLTLIQKYDCNLSTKKMKCVSDPGCSCQIV